jgi:hypothetical protein
VIPGIIVKTRPQVGRSRRGEGFMARRVGLVERVSDGVGTFWGFVLHDHEGAPIVIFGYLNRNAADLARESLIRIVVDSAVLMRSP